jgi:RNA polymerase sigma factor (sigma-70 family)
VLGYTESGRQASGRVVDGPTEEATAFCGRVRPRLVGALILYCGDAAVAEELAQDALLRAWTRWRHIDDPEPWTYRVAFNLARSRFRRLAAERRAHQRVGVDQAYALPDVASAVVLRAAVAQLPDRQRAALVARFYLGLDVAGAAAALSCAPGTVKALTHQAVERLRTVLSVEEGDEEVVDGVP